MTIKTGKDIDSSKTKKLVLKPVTERDTRVKQDEL